MDFAAIKERHRALQEEWDCWRPLWQDCTDFILPRKSGWFAATPGDRRGVQLYDSTGVYANRIWAAGLGMALTNPQRPWYRLGLDDPDLAQWGPVKQVLAAIESWFAVMFTQGNFYPQVQESYYDLGCTGTPIVWIEEDIEEIALFRTRHLAECMVGQNARGQIDTLFRKFQFTARQAYQQWGNEIGSRIGRIFRESPDRKVEILHAVFPRENYQPWRLDKYNMPIGSYYLDMEGEHLIEEGGYRRLPFVVYRASLNSGEQYGRSPGMDALPEIMGLNEMRLAVIKAGQKSVEPTVFLPDDGYMGSGQVDLTPGGFGFYRADLGEPFVPNFAPGLQLGPQLLQDSRQQILDLFSVSGFLSVLRKPNMSATEAAEIAGEKMMLQVPTIGRAMHEAMDPMFDRCFDILLRHPRVQLPPMPRELQGRLLNIEYISPLALALRSMEVQSIHDTYGFAAQIAAVNPLVLDNFDDDVNVRRVAELSGMPLTGMRTPEAVAKKRQRDQEIKMQQNALALAEQLTTGAK